MESSLIDKVLNGKMDSSSIDKVLNGKNKDKALGFMIGYIEQRIFLVENKLEHVSCTGADMDWEEEVVRLLEDLNRCHSFLLNLAEEDDVQE